MFRSGPVAGPEDVAEPATGRHAFGRARPFAYHPRFPQGRLCLTGVLGSGKSTLARRCSPKSWAVLHGRVGRDEALRALTAADVRDAPHRRHTA